MTELVDINATIGRLSMPLFGSWLDTPALLAEMDRFGIAAAAVTHANGRELDAPRGNQALLEALAGTEGAHSRLYPVATLFPPHGKSDGAVAEQLLTFVGSPAVAARLHPNPTHDVMDESVHPRHYPLLTDTVGTVCEELASRGLPLLLEIAEARWEEVYALCRELPALNVVVLGMSYTHKRSLYAGLERYDNLHFEISGFHVQEGLEELVACFGAERALFGTRLPRYTAASAVAMLSYAAVSDAAKALIGGGNARRLLALPGGQA